MACLPQVVHAQWVCRPTEKHFKHIVRVYTNPRVRHIPRVWGVDTCGRETRAPRAAHSRSSRVPGGRSCYSTRWFAANHLCRADGSPGTFDTLWAPSLREERVLRVERGRQVGYMDVTQEKRARARVALFVTHISTPRCFKGIKGEHKTCLKLLGVDAADWRAQHSVGSGGGEHMERWAMMWCGRRYTSTNSTYCVGTCGYTLSEHVCR